MHPWFTVSNVDQIASPSLLVFPDRIEENIRRMISLAGGVQRLRPHVKTHKLPQVVRMKLDAGITKFKTSTIAEAEMTAAAGGTDVLLAMQPVGPNVLRLVELVRRFPQTKFSSIVDNLDTVLTVQNAAKQGNVQIGLYVDLDVGMHRTGVAPDNSAIAIYRLIGQCDHLEAAGLHAYDGHLHDVDYARLESSVSVAFEPVWRLRNQLRDQGMVVRHIIASGTPTFRILAAIPEVEVGCGTTVLWDAGQPKTSPDLGFLNAAVLLTRVVSKPQVDRLCLDLGHKAVASEMQQPRVQFLNLQDPKEIVKHNEEHMVVQTPHAHECQVGDCLYALPHHICPTVALHQEVVVVRDGLASETWPVVARARKLTI